MCVIFIKTHVFITDLVSFSEGGGLNKKLYSFKMKKIVAFFNCRLALQTLV